MPKRVELIPGEDHPDPSLDTETSEWVKQEITGCSFPDQRLRQRLQQLLQQLSSGLGESIPFACQDWASTKAAYRFLSNPRVNEGAILAGHFQSTRSRFAATDSPLLILHDATEFTFARNDLCPVGLLHKSFRRKGKKGRPLHSFRVIGKKGLPLHSVVCGILMHRSLAITPDGLPLEQADIKFWTRCNF